MRSSGEEKTLNDQKTAAGEYPVLIGVQGLLDGQRWEVRSSLTIGRGEDCDIVIDDRQVSRHHARVFNNQGSIELEDLTSKNGTFHSGKQLKEKSFPKDGDLIQIAMVQKFVYYSSDATMPLEDFLGSVMGGEKRLILDQKSRRVWIKGEELTPPLSAPQFRLLATLVSQSGRVIPRNELILAIWTDEEAEGVSEQALDALIRRLRDRLAEIDPDQDYIKTIRGHGLRFGDQ